MRAHRPKRTLRWGRVACALCLGVVVSGCATPALNSARQDFYAGRIDAAESTLDSTRFPRRNRVLFYMERGTVRQAQGDFEGSATDFIAAYDRLVELETRSISRGAGSLVINDSIRDFVGHPFERTLLHAMTAHNHFARGHWDNAAVEARRIVQSLHEDRRGRFPDEPYSRYIAGLAFAMIDDPSNAALQFRLANELLPHLDITERGWISYARPPDTEEGKAIHGAWPVDATAPEQAIDSSHTHELVVAFQTGRSLRGGSVVGSLPHHRAPVYAEVHINGQYAGRTFALSDTAFLLAETQRVRALREAARTISRIAVKEGIAVAVEQSNELAGDLVRLVLIGLLEQPDTRAWETLPRWFHVARVPAPPDLTSYTLVLKGAQGQTIRTIEVDAPLNRRRNVFVSVVRDMRSMSPRAR